MKYSVILPVFNEAPNLDKLIDRTATVLKSLSKEYEIIFINDGSTDLSLDILKSYRERNSNIKIINFSRNFGHQTAVSAGLEYASGDYVAILDADLQDPPELLPKFFAKLDEGFEVVYAIRKKRKESWLKRAGYKYFYRILKLLADIEIPLDSGDFCVMTNRVVKQINKLPERHRYVRGLRSWVGFRQTGMEYERSARNAGETKYPFKKLVRLALDGVFSFSYTPLQLLTMIGLVTFLISIAGSLIAVYMRFFTDIFVPGFATTVILISFLGGLNMLSTGILGEYVGRIYDEVKNRPHFVIDSLIGFDKKTDE